MCPFSILAFLQPTTVDKEPILMIIPFQKHRFLACLVEPMRARFQQ